MDNIYFELLKVNNQDISNRQHVQSILKNKRISKLEFVQDVVVNSLEERTNMAYFMGVKNCNPFCVLLLGGSLMNDNEKLISEGILDLKEISSLSMEYLENILDPFLDEVTSAIPIVGVIKGLAKTGTRIRERHFFKKDIDFHETA